MSGIVGRGRLFSLSSDVGGTGWKLSRRCTSQTSWRKKDSVRPREQCGSHWVVRGVEQEGSSFESPEVYDAEDDDLQLTDAERELLTADYVEDEDASPEKTLPADMAELFSSPFLALTDDGQETLVGSDTINQSYADRKQFVDPEALEESKRFGIAMAKAADDVKCQSIRLLDVHTQVDWTDMFLLLTAMSRTQLRAALGKIEKVANEEWGVEVLESVTRRSEWECIDFGNLVVHAFSPRTREHYNLDKLYSRCTEIEVPLPQRTDIPQWQRSLKTP